jgi:hypothetical protein
MVRRQSLKTVGSLGPAVASSNLVVIAPRLKRQPHLRELLFRFLGRLQIFLRGREGLLAEPGLHGSPVDPGAEPTYDAGIKGLSD